MTAYEYILSLGLRSVVISVVGDDLEIVAAAGALSEADQAELRGRKREIIETLIRRQTIYERVRSACAETHHRLGQQISWSSDTPQARAAEQHLEECMGNYIEGNGSLEAVQGAFKSWIHTLEIETTQIDRM